MTRTEPRWTVTLVYATRNGPVDVEHQVEELPEIEALVERGPDWNSLIEVKVRLTPSRRTAFSFADDS